LRRNQRPRASFSLAGFEVTLIGRFRVTPEANPHITQLTRSEAKNNTSMLKETWDERHIFGKK
jgi:hypothetical protein